MSLAQQLWQDHADLAEACLAHPFVQGIGDGSLPRARFAYYIGQDAFYLQAFARAYLLAAARAPDWDGFRQLHELAGGVLQELELHQTVARSWGLDLATVTPGRETRRYTDFLLASAWGQDVGLTLAAMTPCMRLYAFLGQRLAAEQQSIHTYSDWVQTYSSTGFAALAAQLEALLDRYALQTTATTAAYGYAMDCEQAFFSAAWAC